MENQNKDIHKEYEKSQRKIVKIRTKYLKKLLDIREKAFFTAAEMQRKLFEAGANYSEIRDAITEYRESFISCLVINDEVDENTIGEAATEIIMQEKQNHN